jgi:hypothetical protein
VVLPVAVGDAAPDNADAAAAAGEFLMAADPLPTGLPPLRGATAKDRDVFTYKQNVCRDAQGHTHSLDITSHPCKFKPVMHGYIGTKMTTMYMLLYELLEVSRTCLSYS